MGLKRWFSSQRVCPTPPENPRVQFPAPMLSSPQMLLTPSLADLVPSSGLQGHCTHEYTNPPHTHTHIFLKHLFYSYLFCVNVWHVCGHTCSVMCKCIGHIDSSMYMVYVYMPVSGTILCFLGGIIPFPTVALLMCAPPNTESMQAFPSLHSLPATCCLLLLW